MAFSPDGTTLYVASQKNVHVLSLDGDPEGNTRIILEDARLRSGPGSDFQQVGGLAAGTVVEIIGQSDAGDWLGLADFLVGPYMR